MAQSLAERLKENEEARRSRTERELDALEGDSVPSPKPKPKAKPKEQVGTGRDDSRSNADRLISQLRARINATSDPDLKAKLRARIKAIEETVTK